MGSDARTPAPVAHPTQASMDAIDITTGNSAGPAPTKYTKTRVQALQHESDVPAVSTEILEQRLTRRLNVFERFLTDEQLTEYLRTAKLKDIVIAEAIYTDKLMKLRAAPAILMGVKEQTALDEMVPALLLEMKRRGLSAKLTERTAEFSTYDDTDSQTRPTLVTE